MAAKAPKKLIPEKITGDWYHYRRRGEVIARLLEADKWLVIENDEALVYSAEEFEATFTSLPPSKHDSHPAAR